MPQHETYVMQIWRSRSLAGWQWVARVERLSDGQRLRFTDPEALLAYVQGLVLHTPDIAGTGGEIGLPREPD